MELKFPETSEEKANALKGLVATWMAARERASQLGHENAVARYDWMIEDVLKQLATHEAPPTTN